MQFWVKLNRFLWMLIFVAGLVAIISMFIPQFGRYRELQLRQIRLEEARRQEDVRLKYYREQQDQFGSDPAFVELTARKAGMVMTNEVLVKAVDNPADSRR